MNTFNFKDIKAAQDVEQREKLLIDEVIALYPDGVPVDGFDILRNKDGKEYSVIEIAGSHNYFNGGKVATDICKEWAAAFGGDCRAASAALREQGGVSFVLTRKRSKSGREYTAIRIV